MKNLTIGQTVYSIGVNMKCKHVVTKSTVVGFKGDRVVVKNGGINIICRPEDFFADKKEATAALVAQGETK